MGKGLVRWVYERLDEGLFGRTEHDRLVQAIDKENKRLEVERLRKELERLRAQA